MLPGSSIRRNLLGDPHHTDPPTCSHPPLFDNSNIGKSGTMARTNSPSHAKFCLALQALLTLTCILTQCVQGQESAAQPKADTIAAADEAAFKTRVGPLLQEFCVRCHN